MYTGNPHQDHPFSKGFQQGWSDRKLPPWGIKDDSKMYPGGPPGDPKNVFPTFPLPRREDSENWIPYEGGGLGPLAELTQKQMDFMGSPYNTPAFGVSKEDLWDRTKDMEKKGFFGWGAQEPTTRKEFNDYYNQLQEGTTGNWLASKGYEDMTPYGGSSYWGDDYYFPTDYIYKDTSDMFKSNPMRDDYFVQDPFSDIWGGQGGPLQFG
jgi:hypothetical protein